ncbi:MAG: PspC domain-containing protein [Patescibacteria group bacterium]
MEKRLYRNDDNKAIGGVMSGLSDYFGGDPVLWRLGIILLALMTAIVPVAIVYGIAWWIIPERPQATYRVVE